LEHARTRQIAGRVIVCPQFQLPTVAKLNNNTLDFSSFNKETNTAYSGWKQNIWMRKKKQEKLWAKHIATNFREILHSDC
jgi:hypothetical protein